MKQISLLWIGLVVTCVSALAVPRGETCEDAIPITKDFQATATPGQDVWYSAWTYDLPLTVYFTPSDPNSEKPTIEADFTCTKGQYDNEQLQKFFGQGSTSAGGLEVMMPYKLQLKETTNQSGAKTYELSMPNTLRTQMSAYLGITENIQVFVHAHFPGEGGIQIVQDTAFNQCMESGNWVKLGEPFPVEEHDEVSVYNIALGDWRNDSVRMIWNGQGANTIYLGVNKCDFEHKAGNGDFYKSYTFKAGKDTIKIPNSEIKEMMKTAIQTGAIYYMHTDAESEGVLLFEHQPEPQAEGGALRLNIDEITLADSSRLYYFPRAWKDSNIIFTTEAVNKFRMVVASAPFDKEESTTDTHVLGTYPFAKTDDGHELKLQKSQMTALVNKVDKEQLYLYVRFYCIDKKAKVTPSTWTPDACDTKATPIEFGTPLSIGKYTGKENYQLPDTAWCGSDLTISWDATSSITLQAYVNNKSTRTSDPSSSTNPDLIWSTKWDNKAAIKGGNSLTIPAATTKEWIEKVDDCGNLYIFLSPSGNGKVTITSAYEEQEVEIPAAELDSTFIVMENAADTHLYTGVGEGYSLETEMEGSTYRPIDLSHCFGADEQPLFDLMYVFTTTTTQTQTVTQTVTAPTNKAGSNAKTPCYIYAREDEGYRLQRVVENVNTCDPIVNAITMSSAAYEQKSIYFTGFAPYASCGFTKDDEGVFHFRAGAGDTLDIYIEDAYIYSRTKTIDGSLSTSTTGTFSEDYARGSGAVFAIECSAMSSNKKSPMQATIHMRGSNRLTSVNGCYYNMIGGMVNHACAPVEIHMNSRNAAENMPTYTVLTITDEWNGTRTKGSLSLRKQANNAPSIDLGNARTVLNLRGGQLELQNAVIATTNYKNTLAISYRSGLVGGQFLSYGIGADNAGGTVNFYDGTTTVIPMKVEEKYRQYYLMDEDGETTSCLRCPENTHVYGGSHCWMRACSSVESRGGSPMGYGEQTVGQIIYTDETLPTFDKESPCIGGTYGTESLTADAKGQYYLWIPAACDPSIRPEEDQPMRYWLAAMTEIEATSGSFGGRVGGETEIGNQVVSNLLYCQIDDYISEVISDPSYTAPVKNPAGGGYVDITPSYVGYELSNDVIDEEDYTILDHIYYVCPAKADEWMTFAAPFDVNRVWVLESFSEDSLARMTAYGTEDDYDYLPQREVILREQAKHNADFAGFFAVVVALGSNTSFDEIFRDYLAWGKAQDKANGLWDGVSEYELRSKKALKPMMTQTQTMTKTQTTGEFYLKESVGNWMLSEDMSLLLPRWEVPAAAATYDPANPTTLMQKGHVYSMLFPYYYGTEQMDTESEREEWDYWSGKLLILEGKGQKVSGKKRQREMQQALSVSANEGVMSGNFTLAAVTSTEGMSSDVYQFVGELGNEQFYRTDAITPIDEDNSIAATQAFLMADIENNRLGIAQSVRLENGEITYRPNPASGTDETIEATTCTKMMINGQLYIEHNGQRYTILGERAK